LTPLSPPFYTYILFLFHIVPPRSALLTGPFLPSNPNQINQTNKRNFDKMSFTMKSKSLFLSLSLSLFSSSICLSVSFLLFLQPARPRPVTYSGLFCFFVALLPHPSAPPVESRYPGWGVRHWIFTTNYHYYKNTRIVSGHGCWES